MTQEIVTYLIIGAAVSATLWKLYRQSGRKNKKEDCGEPANQDGSGCGSCTVDCPLKPGARLP